MLEGVNGILVPGGFGERGAEGKILSRRFCPHPHNVPYFGICFGMQMAVIEAARNPGRSSRPQTRPEFGETAECRCWFDD